MTLPLRIAATLLLAATAASHAQERAELERAPIVGNRELPKVLVFVPWKQPLPGVPSGKPVNSVLDAPFTPLDPAVFRRSIDYGAQARAAAALPPAATQTQKTSGESR